MTIYSLDKGKHFEEGSWPPLRGDFVIFDPEGRVAVVTLASNLRIENAAIGGTCKTENLGIEKIVANIISNSNIRFLLICGVESKGHLPGNTLIALHENGIDEKGRIIGSKGAIPFIQNLTPEAIKRFQAQIQLIDRIGLEDEREIAILVKEHSGRIGPYEEEPFQVVKPRKKPIVDMGGGILIGDITFGSGIFMDSAAWLVRRDEIVQV
jgi:tetrahydromethanopterin S-methyltransferase subunit A